MKISAVILFCVQFCSFLNADDAVEAQILKRMKRLEHKLQRLEAEGDIKNDKIKTLQEEVDFVKAKLEERIEGKCSHNHLESMNQRLTRLEKLCPVGDPRYHLILNKCYYFEDRPMNYPDAKFNCQDKFYGEIGQLLEPHFPLTTEHIYFTAKNGFNFASGIWIGIEHFNASFVWATSQQSVQTPVWNQGQPDLLEAASVPGINCVVMGFEATSFWNIAMCGSLYNSICEKSFVLQQELPDYQPLEEQEYYDSY